jgi:hypothetical protein
MLAHNNRHAVLANSLVPPRTDRTNSARQQAFDIVLIPPQWELKLLDQCAFRVAPGCTNATYAVLATPVPMPRKFVCDKPGVASTAVVIALHERADPHPWRSATVTDESSDLDGDPVRSIACAAASEFQFDRSTHSCESGTTFGTKDASTNTAGLPVADVSGSLITFASHWSVGMPRDVGSAAVGHTCVSIPA